MHIMKPENQDWMKYYGISAVPLQILLDREGKEFYRHFGVISTEDLLAKFKELKMSYLIHFSFSVQIFLSEIDILSKSKSN